MLSNLTLGLQKILTRKGFPVLLLLFSKMLQLKLSLFVLIEAVYGTGCRPQAPARGFVGKNLTVATL